MTAVEEYKDTKEKGEQCWLILIANQYVQGYFIPRG